MDNFWIFIVIIGAVISLAQKGLKQAPAESDDTTQPNPQQEWERRIREIMNEQKGSTPPLGREATTAAPNRYTYAEGHTHRQQRRKGSDISNNTQETNIRAKAGEF